MTTRLREAVQAVVDSVAFEGPSGAAQERSLVRSVEGVIARVLPRGTRAVITYRAEDEGPILEVVLLGGARRVETLRFNISTM